MVVETTPKKILDKLESGVKVVNPSGAGLKTLNHGSTNGGTNWYPHKVDASGHVSVKQATIKTHNVYSFHEYLAENGTRIIQAREQTNSAASIYTVPAGKVFYLCSAQLSSYLGASTSSAAKLYNAIPNWILYLKSQTIDSGAQSSTVNFTIPLKFTAGQSINVSSSSVACLAIGMITGYIIDA